MEKHITFLSENYQIEGLFEKNSDVRGAVITHPHPLYGGNMYNNIVEAITRIYHNKGYTTLRFNFRGVGSSQGSFDNGVGEQEDVCAAISYLRDVGINSFDLAGYSFGVSVNIKAIEKAIAVEHVKRMIMVSPPVGFIEANIVKPIDKEIWVITGSQDNIAVPVTIERVLSQWNPKAILSVIEGADHFYSGYVDQLESILGTHL
jgi:alpha/beta superfamily hydrolase